MVKPRGGRMKYIVKNCPATTGTNGFCGDDRPEVFCQDCTNCLIKQVIEKCRKYGVTYLGNEILQLFEIEECE